ncbi:uncharacterized protein LOC126844450 isoform X2 [Adelges cooleyi]|uniref:uncharacterized protein LOC126844450 isoform X2 n=1 Tax=Adelges cooleyi TaxID=133065 RepID=UPI002180045A|nr:uncharacterized protein LOC126844450 isoform X2 [Adelges cooleyi]
MEISKHFLGILKSIDYHVGHLPKDVLANEVQLPELSPLFTWFLNNVSPKSNCVTTKELALKKKETLNIEISQLEKKDEETSKSCYAMNSNLDKISNNFTESLENFGNKVSKLHSNAINTISNDDGCLTKLATAKLVNLTIAWRQQILKMIQIWFEEENNSPNENVSYTSKIKQLCLFLKSIKALKTAVYLRKRECLNLNTAINNTFNMINYIKEDKENLHFNELNMSNFILKVNKPQSHFIENSCTLESNNSTSYLSNIVIADAENKLNQLETMFNQISIIEESIEHYIIMCDVLWCLMRTDCSIADVKCELIVYCNDLLDRLHYDIKQAKESTLHNLNTIKDNIDVKTKEIVFHQDIKFDVYKPYFNSYNENDGMKRLLKAIQKWKSKYHYTRDECNKLMTLQTQIQEFNNKLAGLTGNEV